MHQDLERAVTPKETEPKLRARVGGLPVDVWVSRGSPQGWKVPRGVNPLGLYHRARRPQGWVTQAKQLPGREGNPPHQQIIGLKLY